MIQAISANETKSDYKKIGCLQQNTYFCKENVSSFPKIPQIFLPALVCASLAMQSAAKPLGSSDFELSNRPTKVLIPSAEDKAGSLSGIILERTTILKRKIKTLTCSDMQHAGVSHGRCKRIEPRSSNCVLYLLQLSKMQHVRRSCNCTTKLAQSLAFNPID